MASLNELFNALGESLKNAQEHATQFENGKKAAAGRLRKEAQVSKKLWQDIRIATMDTLKSMPTKTRAAKS